MTKKIDVQFIYTWEVHFKGGFGTSTYVNHSVNRGSVSKKHHFKPENKQTKKILAWRKIILFFY